MRQRRSCARSRRRSPIDRRRARPISGAGRRRWSSARRSPRRFPDVASSLKAAALWQDSGKSEHRRKGTITMIIGIPRETRPGETRVAATPETVKKLAASGKHDIVVEPDAGVLSSVPDDLYTAAGARIGSATETLGADIVLKVRGPSTEELPRLKRGAMLIGLLNPFDSAAISAYAATGV